jgi:hypothetical protein
MRQGEDQVKVAAGKEFGLAVIEPLFFNQGLALGTVSIPARVVGVSFQTAVVALLDMAPEYGSPAYLYMPYNLLL